MGTTRRTMLALAALPLLLLASARPALAQSAQPSRTGTYGGNGGRLFDDSDAYQKELGPITTIVVRAGLRIDGVGIGYQNGRYVYHGGLGGKETTVKLLENEYVYKVDVRSGERVDALKFYIKGGATPRSVSFGGPGGAPRTIEFGGNNALLYLLGRSGYELDQIGFAHGQRPATLKSPLERSGAYGGTGGNTFDDLGSNNLPLGRIKHITVRAGDRIDRLETTYGNNETKRWGGTGGQEQSIDMRGGEYIVGVKVRSGQEVDYLELETNQGRYLRFGGTGGTLRTISPPAGKDWVVVGFFGRAGSRLDNLGVYWGKVSRVPETINIQNLTFDVRKGSVTKLEPQIAFTTTQRNDSDLDQTLSKTFSTEYTTSRSFETSESNTWGASVTVSMAAEVSLPVVSPTLEVSVTGSMEKTKSVTFGTVEEKKESVTGQFNATVEKRSRLQADFAVTKGQMDIPWSADATITYDDGFTETKKIKGTWKGTQSLKAEAAYKKLPL